MIFHEDESRNKWFPGVGNHLISPVLRFSRASSVFRFGEARGARDPL